MMSTSGAVAGSATSSDAPEWRARNARSRPRSMSEQGTATAPAFNTPTQQRVPVRRLADEHEHPVAGTHPAPAKQARPSCRTGGQLGKRDVLGSAAGADECHPEPAPILREHLDDVAGKVEAGRHAPPAVHDRRRQLGHGSDDSRGSCRAHKSEAARCRAASRSRRGLRSHVHCDPPQQGSVITRADACPGRVNQACSFLYSLRGR